MLAWNEFHPDVIVLDDGMQYWQLHRDLNIVLLNACDPFDNGYTFPRGLLREPPSHLRRAGIVVLTNARRAEPEQRETLKKTGLPPRAQSSHLHRRSRACRTARRCG
jgi:tetraacyldisaccharide 4'-kinase